MGHDAQTRDERNSSLFLQGGGEMGELIRSMDWSKTPLGPPESWPDSLRTTLNLCLASNVPLCFAWGPQRVQIYNDGYWPLCASKHPGSMGQDFKECWQSAWPVIGPGFERCVASGETTFLTDTRMFLDRKGELEETFFTFSFSPIRDEAGAVAGVFHPVTETTHLVLAQRRLGVLRDVASRTADAQTIEAALDAIGRALAAHPLDVPFVLLYRLPADSGLPRLAGSAGLRPGAPAAPECLEQGGENRPCWPIPEGGSAACPIELGDLAERVGSVVCDPYPEALRTALVFPIIPGGSGRAAAVLVVGVSPRRPLDEAYRGFFDMLAGVVTTAVSNAHAHAEERRRAEALAELDRAKTAFFSNVSHEFRTPLTLILGPVENTLADSAEPMTPRQRERLEIVQRNALRMQKLVNTLLDFSRIEAGRVQASYEATDIAALTAELASNFRSAWLGSENEDKYRQAVESAPNGMLMIDPKGKIVLVNAQTEKLFGYNREELIGQPVELLVPERFRSRHPEYRSGFFTRPQVRSMGIGRELYGRRKDGSEFPVEIGLNPIETNEGLLVLSVIVDITERKRAEKVLRESEQRYHILAETMLHGVLHQDASGRIIALNPAAERILGKTREQILGSTSVREEHDSTREDGSPFPGLEHPSMVALRTGQTLGGVVMGVFNPQEGVRRWITIDAVPVYRPGESEPAEVFTVFEDITERRYAEAEQRKLVNLIEHSRDFIAVADPTGKLTFLNASGRKMIGLDENEDFSRIQFNDYVPPEWQDFFRHTVIRTAREQGLWEGEMQLRNLQTDARIDVFRSIFYIHDAARGEGYYATVTRDITESKRAERLLRESEVKYRNLFQNMSEEVHFWKLVRDDQGNIRTWKLVDANPPALRTWGKTLEEIVGKTTDAIFGPGASEHYLEIVRKIMTEGVSYHFEDYFPNLDRYFRFSSVPLGECFFTTGADITSSKKAHLALEKAHNKLQAVLTSITDGLLVLDRNWVYTYFSEQAGRILGVSPEEVVGRCIWDLFPHASNLKFHEGFHRAVESRQAVHFEEYYPEPLNQWFECHCYPSEEGLSVYFRDVTEPKQAEKVLQRVNADLERGMQQLAEANREAKAKTQENEAFVYSVSHDLRSPLVNLQGFSKELGRSAHELRTLLTETELSPSERDRGFAILDGKVAKSIHFIQTAVARLSNIIDALLRLSRAGRVIYQRQRVDPRAIVTRVVESLKITTEERRATIQIDDLPPALGDPAALEQIFANLIGNALNYLDSKRPGTIEIGSLDLRPGGATANMRTYSIRDNGLGIPAVSAAKIFQPFQRLHPQAAPGEGMGLAIVQRVVERLGGKVWFESIVGQGTTFFVDLPACPSGESTGAPGAASAFDPRS